MTTSLRPPVSARRRPLMITTGIVVFLLIILGAVATVATDILWFRETGFTAVFWASIWSRVALGAAFGAAFAVLLLLNLWIVRRITSPTRLFSVPDQVLERYRATLQPYARWAVVGGAVVFGLFAGSGAVVQWRQWLLFRNAVDFGQTDPVFGNDIGFYVFRLPFLQFVFAWLFSTLVLITIIVAIAHYFMGGIRPQARGDRVAPEVRAHLSVLLGLIVLLKAWGYRLDQYNLLYSERGTVTGASYTDVHAQLPALRLLVIIALIAALFFFVNARFKNWVLPLGAIALLALVSVIAGGVYPATVQRLRVTPNERLRERPFIVRNIEATRAGYGLDGVDVRSLPASQNLSLADLRRNAETVENIRVWDERVLVDAYVNLQRIKQYYEFLDADVDRYTINGRRRQVLIAPREIHLDGLDESARTWLNTHLVYTHGYGVVASRVNTATSEGQPAFMIRDIPPVENANAPEVTQPQIYFGESSDPAFVVVNSAQPELDYPMEGESGIAETQYDGTGGIELSGILRRAAFAWRFRDVNLLISSAVTDESRILIHRDIRERVLRVAPFLQIDDDPYVALVDGRTKWIVDAYTMTDMYPYSARVSFAEASDGAIRGTGNYLRNSVKFVVDAKDGTVEAYRWDESDPILAAWAKVFPDMFKPRSEMSEGLLAHVRYPEAIFKVQTELYSTYHITNADNFYSKEDAWRVANDPTAASGEFAAPIRVAPYYLLIKLPGEQGGGLDFVLVRPYTPRGRQNLSGYIVAHGDPDKYGKLVSYRLPKSSNIFGPEQVQARINQDPVVKPYITLNDQAGARVIRGNLLIIPIEQSLLYVQPLYVRGQGTNLPELKRVVVVFGENVRMAPTLDEALALAFTGREPEGPGQPEETVGQLLEEALRHLRAAQEALRNGDFAAYGREQAAMERALEEAAERSGAAQPTPSPSPAP